MPAKSKSKKAESEHLQEVLFDEAASLEEVLAAMGTHLAEKYQQRTLEQLEDKRETARQRFEQHAATLAQAQDLVAEAYVQDARSLNEDDLDADPAGRQVREAR